MMKGLKKLDLTGERFSKVHPFGPNAFAIAADSEYIDVHLAGTKHGKVRINGSPMFLL